MTGKIQDRLEAKWEQGHRQAWLAMLGDVLRGLGYGPQWNRARLIAERAEAIVALRQICADHGDNDWSDELNLADIIEKHLNRHLPEPPDE